MRKTIFFLVLCLLLAVSCSQDPIPQVQSSTVSEQEYVYVKFDANGGEGKMADQRLEKSIYTALTALNFSKTGYRFTGWNTNEDGSGKWYDDGQTILLDMDTTLYAQWVKRIRITFDGKGAKGSMQMFIIDEGEEFTVPANAYTYSGKAFLGWETDAGVQVADGGTITPSNDTVLRARWVDGITISFNANGGVGSKDPITAARGMYYPIGSSNMTCQGKVFAGWNTASDYTGTAYADEAEVCFDQDTVLYAQWMEPSCVILINNGVIANTMSANVSGNVPIPRTIDGVEVEAVLDAAFFYCTELEAVTIPDSVLAVGDEAFYGCAKLEEVIFGSSVVSIGAQALAECPSLQTIVLRSVIPPEITADIFENSVVPAIRVPAEALSTYLQSSFWSPYAAHITAD